MGEKLLLMFFYLMFSFEQYHRQRAPLKHLCRCVVLRPINWNLDQNLGGSAVGGDIVLELTPSFFFNFNYYKITANFLVFFSFEDSVFIFNLSN
jgi:hypothetical protein